jgi:hypothetical protein
VFNQDSSSPGYGGDGVTIRAGHNLAVLTAQWIPNATLKTNVDQIFTNLWGKDKMRIIGQVNNFSQN